MAEAIRLGAISAPTSPSSDVSVASLDLTFDGVAVKIEWDWRHVWVISIWEHRWRGRVHSPHCMGGLTLRVRREAVQEAVGMAAEVARRWKEVRALEDAHREAERQLRQWCRSTSDCQDGSEPWEETWQFRTLTGLTT